MSAIPLSTENHTRNPFEEILNSLHTFGHMYLGVLLFPFWVVWSFRREFMTWGLGERICGFIAFAVITLFGVGVYQALQNNWTFIGWVASSCLALVLIVMLTFVAICAQVDDR